MKKRILALLLSCVLCTGLVSTSFALTEIFDENGNSMGIDKDNTSTDDGKKDPENTGSSSGGSYIPPAVPTYKVTTAANANGTVSTDKSSPKAGDTVVVTFKPSSGYRVDSFTVTDAKGNVIATTNLGGDQYSFTMPASDVSITAKFGPAVTTNPFVDVAQGEYYYDAVLWAVAKGITTGTSANTFSPNETCTRAQTVTFLWRAAGSPAPASSSNSFTDVNPGEYYYNAVLWAVENGITNGTSDTTFSPDETVTRGQTVTFLYRAAKAQAVEGSNPFVDVESGEYYAQPVQWAVSKGITNGTSASTFSPSEGCTRGQIVTFLYRAS